MSYWHDGDTGLEYRVTSFFSLLWPGVLETDEPQLYYFYADNKNITESSEARAALLNLSKRLVGIFQIANSLTGASTCGFVTQIFHAQRQSIVVRRVLPYYLILGIQKDLLDGALLSLLNLLTQTVFYDSGNVPIAHVEGTAPPAPWPAEYAEQTVEQLNLLLLRAFQEPSCCNFLVGAYHPVLLPRDVVTPHIFALQQLKALGQCCPTALFCVLKNGRVLLSTAGPFMTNYACLLTGCAPAAHNRRVHYAFGSYFADRAPQSAFQDGAHPDERFMSFSTLYISNLAACGVYAVVLSQETIDLKRGALQTHLQQLHEKLQYQGQTPAVFARPDTFYPLFSPIPGPVDVCGVDCGRLLWALRGIYGLRIAETAPDYGISALDAAALTYVLRRRSVCLLAAATYDFHLSEQFVLYDSGLVYEDATTRSTDGLAKLLRKINNIGVQLIVCYTQAGGAIQIGSAIATPGNTFSDTQKQIHETIGAYIRTK